MEHAPRSVIKRALAVVLVALVVAAVLGGCSLPSLSSDDHTTSTPSSFPPETWESTTVTKTPKKPTSTTARPSSSSSTTRRSTTTSTTAVARSTAQDAKAIAAKVKSSVVLVAAVSETDTTGYFELDGTGVVYKTSGSYAYIVTNNHVIERSDGKASKRIRVTLPSGSTVTAKLIGRDPTRDLAVLRVKSKKVTAAIFRTDLSELEEGDFVVALGKPKQLKHPVVSGEVTGFYQNIEYPDSELSGIDAIIEISAPLVQGFSGGPLLDSRGRVIGINMAKFIDEPGGISLPADFVVKVVERLLAAS